MSNSSGLISAVIHTYNSERTLATCLDSIVGQVDEILICDMHSTDKTVAIAERYGARVIYHENVGFPEPARLFAIGESRGDWILVLDSDEAIQPKLLAHLKQAIQPNAPQPCPDLFRVARVNHFLGKFNRADWPDYHVRFFRKTNLFDWPPYVHRGASVSGLEVYTPAKFDMAIIHYNFDTITSFLEKLDRYTSLEVEKLQSKQYKLPLWVHCVYRAHFEFFKRYILKQGFRGGSRGLYFSILMAFYKATAYMKLWQAQADPMEVTVALPELKPENSETMLVN